MRILFFGDYSNLHACLAGELRRRGHSVTVVSDGGRYMDTARDILLDRKPGIKGTISYLARLFSLLPRLKGYDVVQLINPHFVALRPEKIRKVFDTLRRNNGSVFLTLAGDDHHFCNACINSDLFRYSEFRVGSQLTEFERISRRGSKWADPALKGYAEYLYEKIDGAMSVLPEYDMAARPLLDDRLAFTNIPVDIEAIKHLRKPFDISGKINLFIGIRGGMEVQKGTGLLLDMCRRLEKDMPERCCVTQVSNLPLSEYLSLMSNCHILLDQLYSYSPATNALQAMALGRVAASGAQPEYYRYIGEERYNPVISLSPLESIGEIEERFRKLILDPEPLVMIASDGQIIVERHNALPVVTTKFERHWNSILR